MVLVYTLAALQSTQREAFCVVFYASDAHSIWLDKSLHPQLFFASCTKVYLFSSNAVRSQSISLISFPIVNIQMHSRGICDRSPFEVQYPTNN